MLIMSKKKWNWYNDTDPSACAWAREAIKAGYVPDGVVDERPIQEVQPEDLKEFAQCHFFSGILGWSIALRMAGWPDDRPVWTGSCPCQPFSSAGRQKGKQDERHLWPVWFRLIRESRPPFVFGEQVRAAIRFGWWDDAADDMEGIGYTTRAEVRPAYSVGRPHKRERLWFVAEPELRRLEREQNARPTGLQCEVDAATESWESVSAHGASTLADSKRQQDHEEQRGPATDERGRGADLFSGRGMDSQQSWLPCPDGKSRLIEPSIRLLVNGLPGRLRKAALHGYGNAIVPQVAAEFIGAYMETLTALCGEYGKEV